MDRYRRPKTANAAAVCFAPALLGNPSHFTVYATVRRSVLARWKNLHGASDSDDSDDDMALAPAKIPKVICSNISDFYDPIRTYQLTLYVSLNSPFTE